MIGDLNFGTILHANRCERVLSNELRISLIFILSIYPDRNTPSYKSKVPSHNFDPLYKDSRSGNASKIRMLVSGLACTASANIAGSSRSTISQIVPRLKS